MSLTSNHDYGAISAEVRSVPALNKNEQPSCDELGVCRPVWKIILSCLVTMFACTWIAVRQNMAYPVDKRRLTASARYLHNMRVYFLERAPLFILLLVFPEHFLAWAVRQRLVARTIAKATSTLRTSPHFPYANSTVI